jgi:hypothetical protein
MILFSNYLNVKVEVIHLNSELETVENLGFYIEPRRRRRADSIGQKSTAV